MTGDCQPIWRPNPSDAGITGTNLTIERLAPAGLSDQAEQGRRPRCFIDDDYDVGRGLGGKAGRERACHTASSARARRWNSALELALSTLVRPLAGPTDHQLTQLALSAQSSCSCGVQGSVASRGDHLRGSRQGIPRARSRGRGTPVLGAPVWTPPPSRVICRRV